MTRFERSKTTDTQLLIRYRDGRDDLAFSELVRRHGQMVMATGRRVLGNEDDAEDVFQATFLALAVAAGKLRAKGAVAGWLHKTAYQCAVTLQRQNIRWEKKTKRLMAYIKTSQNEPDVEPTSGIANEELIKVLDEELARLPEKLSAAVVLCHLEGASQKDAAKQLGVSSSTVNDRVVRGRKLLHERLMRRGIALSMAGLASFGASSSESMRAMSEPLVADITTKATRYAAGKSASEVGVSSTVIELATGISTAMRNAKTLSICLAALAIVFLGNSLRGIVGMVPNAAHAGFIFEDNFDDGSFDDGMPVTWMPETSFPGSYDASSGDLVLANDANTDLSQGLSIRVMDEVHRNVSVRANVTLAGTTGSDWAGAITVRAMPGENGAFPTAYYFASVAYSPAFGGSILIAGKPGNELGPNEFFRTVDGTAAYVLPYDVRQVESTLQLDVIENQISVWAWPAGQPMPNSPAFSVTDDTVDGAGNINLNLAVGANPTGNGQATFSYVGVANHHIPEPSTAALGSLALFALAMRLRRRF